jgi:glutamate-ammonia-ligase adenylyltransferase
VAQEFDKLLLGGKQKGMQGLRHAAGRGGAPPPELEGLLEQLPERLRERVAEWRTHPRVRPCATKRAAA